jgi:2,3-dihydroxy-p-cumate/2,3-dihydroxybenzoate 3,4-dioxygenase
MASVGAGPPYRRQHTFCYFVTPNGNAVEYTSDLEQVDDATWQPQTYHPTPAITDQWGTRRVLTGNVPHAEMTPDKGLWQVPA